ncbi:DMT family transporter [Novosphingobium album (ex Hu et al. 2023)]|uniref:DMT family transporter n=1 Tax=Novosphingobium album (ex Hu et al. 2023) TaxID=2930093 RepID=A0ABT0AYS6_9SPHN|nr:DMT family transporter [Novosphingobium album (ex Hu et al. 2023)]MCJ2177935.1 DMT family transporter [Novosphingobium album (ex Hu et al. 2023)]
MTPSPRLQSQENPLLAIGLRVLAMVMLSTMFMLVKLAGDHGVSIPELLFWRQAMSVPMIFVWLLATGNLGVLATRRMGSHAGRAASGTVGLLCNVSAATLLPLPLQTTLGFTTPLFAVLITALVLRNKVGAWRWTAVVLGFAGVLVVADPDGSYVPPLGLLAGLGAGVVVATVSFQIRDLARTEAPIACVFWFAAYGSLFAAVLTPLYARQHTLVAWLILAAIGFSGTFAQFLITASLRHGQVATVVIIDYTALVWAMLYGWLIWDELPPQHIWLGAPLIIAAGTIITLREHYLSRHISPTSAMDSSVMEEFAEDNPAPQAKGT